jgi:hypothetical protein
MAENAKLFMRYEGIDIWEVSDGLIKFYRSGPVDDLIFTAGTLGEVLVSISTRNFFGCIRRPVKAR